MISEILESSAFILKYVEASQFEHLHLDSAPAGFRSTDCALKALQIRLVPQTGGARYYLDRFIINDQII